MCPKVVELVAMPKLVSLHLEYSMGLEEPDLDVKKCTYLFFCNSLHNGKAWIEIKILQIQLV